MERHDYRAEIRSDIIEALRWESMDDMTDLDDLREHLYEKFFVDDSVTGNASGSYFCNAWKAEEAICHNLDLAEDAYREFGYAGIPYDHGAEAIDCTIRCYLLAEVLDEVLDELTSLIDLCNATSEEVNTAILSMAA